MVYYINATNIECRSIAYRNHRVAVSMSLELEVSYSIHNYRYHAIQLIVYTLWNNSTIVQFMCRWILINLKSQHTRNLGDSAYWRQYEGSSLRIFKVKIIFCKWYSMVILCFISHWFKNPIVKMHQHITVSDSCSKLITLKFDSFSTLNVRWCSHYTLC